MRLMLVLFVVICAFGLLGAQAPSSAQAPKVPAKPSTSPTAQKSSKPVPTAPAPDDIEWWSLQTIEVPSSEKDYVAYRTKQAELLMRAGSVKAARAVLRDRIESELYRAHPNARGEVCPRVADAFEHLETNLESAVRAKRRVAQENRPFADGLAMYFLIVGTHYDNLNADRRCPVEISDEKAMTAYREAAIRGSMVAAHHLAGMYAGMAKETVEGSLLEYKTPKRDSVEAQAWSIIWFVLDRTDGSLHPPMGGDFASPTIKNLSDFAKELHLTDTQKAAAAKRADDILGEMKQTFSSLVYSIPKQLMDGTY